MKLEIGNFYVKSIEFSNETSYENGILRLNKEELLNFIKEDERITDADLHIVNPGEMIRLCPVKEAIEPRVKVDNRALFPGFTGDLENCGHGKTHALKDCSVLVVGKHWGGFQDGLIDMGGKGAKYTYFSKIKNIVLVADTNEDFEKNEQQKKNDALRVAGHKLAEYIAKCVQELEPEEVEVYELEGITKRSEKVNGLPSVVFVMQLQSQMEEDGYNDLTYGWNTNHLVPTLMHPNEILDGAVVSGSFMPCSSKWSTYDIQNAPVIKRLYKEHGKSLNFLGVILSNLNVSLEQKERSAIYVAQIAKTLGADGAIVAEEGYGNPDADFVGCIVALEDVGVKVVGLTNECTGRDGNSQPLVTLDEKLDAIVSCGNVSELIDLPPMEKVIGELESLSRDGLSGGWSDDEILGPSVREDGSIIMENNAMFCGDQVLGWSTKTMKEF
ncbi:glycine/sarcosine/betaine reductase component B subunit [Paraclostridium bifermentans]|uniref:Betaine reductase n=1 Tax=Paraclostridium bifermentans TaxID=1490 RepID=A0AA44DLD6_PARBF|nr:MULTISPECIES: glycine/sarcosine/betaine reductase component B subunit [Paraclostridium]MBN8047604.1 glycine/sarcosine/betaine reductase component B subunit [Paraclostridium bifermentans]MBU5287086.1 glycine/sarcosine/betaine reductase component B subunit [Paraclostridium bifermentans]MBZ6004294.1 glycine/sarcosine/betaine reductase component B subunit [Paraclostridium bifermentans]MDU0296945.1 glycine/sarcosine/betaine reductase component B subunit [Paraclostridium sp. MRS3W1]NME09792.1 bet